MLELNRQVRDMYRAYMHHPLKPETSLEIAGDFALDIINVFGEPLPDSSALKGEWSQFAPFEFILNLNTILGRYKESGYDSLDDTERTLLHDNKVFLSSLINAALTNHPDSFPDEDHFQIPNSVAKELRVLAEFG